MGVLGRFFNFSKVSLLFSIFFFVFCLWKLPLKLPIETSFMQLFWISANLISQNTLKIPNDPFKTYFIAIF